VAKVKIKAAETADGLSLPGLHFPPRSSWKGTRDLAVVLVPGRAHDVFAHPFAQQLGSTLSRKGIGVYYAYNRGRGQVADIAGSASRQGSVFERWDDAVLDVDAWLGRAKQSGYQRIVLMGHSLAASKVVTAMAHPHVAENVDALVLASPVDMVNLGQQVYGPEFAAMADQSRRDPRSMLTDFEHDWPISAGTFNDQHLPGGPADVLSLRDASRPSPELAAVKVPTLGVFGEHEGPPFVARSPEEDLAVLGRKLSNLKEGDYQQAVITSADHIYSGRERALAQLVLGWVRSIGLAPSADKVLARESLA